MQQASLKLPLWSDEQNRLLPLVRAVPSTGLFGTRERVTAVYPDQIIRGWTHRLESLHFKVDDPIQFSKNLHDARGFPLEDKTIVRLYPGGRLTRRAVLRLSGSDRADFQLPHDQITHVAAYLAKQLGDRFHLQNRPVFRSGRSILVAILMWGAAFALALISPWLSSAALPVVLSVEPNFGYLAAAIISLLVAIGILVDRLPLPFPWVKGGFDLESGDRLVLRRPEGHLVNSGKPWTLYFRSIRHGEHHSLASPSRWAYVAGVRSTASLSLPRRLPARLNPLRLFRSLFDDEGDTCEKQFEELFQPAGSLTIVDQSERKASTRTDAVDDQPPNRLSDLADQAQTVIVQPADREKLSEAMEKIFSSVDRSKLLVCLVEFHRKQNEYEAFRLQVEDRLAEPLPKLGGLTSTPAFLFFDSERKVCLRSTCYVNPFLWPLTRNPIDLQTTLKGFLKPLAERRIDVKSGLVPTGYSSGLHLSAAAVWLGLALFAGIASCISLRVSLVAFGGNAALFERIRSTDIAEGSPLKKSASIATRPSGIGGRSDVEDTGQTDQETVVQTNIDLADTAYAKRDFAAMEECVNTARELAPNNPTVLFYQAVLLRERAKHEEAIESMKRVVALAPDVASHWAYLGLLSLQLKQFDATLTACSRALEIDPKLANVRINRGQARLETGDAESALADAEQAMQLDGVDRTAALKLAGLALVRLNRRMEALPHFKERTFIAPDNAEVFRDLGEFLDTLGPVALPEGNAAGLAREAYDRVLNLNPTADDIRFRRASALAREGKLVESLEAFKSLLPKNEKNAAFLSEYAGVQRLVGNYQIASEYYEKALATASEKSPILQSLVVVQVAQGRWDEALANCRAARSTSDAAPISYLQESLLLGELNRDIEASRLRRERLPKLLDRDKLATVVLCLMWAIHGEKDEALLRSALSWIEKTDDSIQSHRMVDILRAAMMERVGRSIEARSVIDGVDDRELSKPQWALSRIVKASVAASLNEASAAAEHLALASAWFARECPASFAEGQPETFPTDWVSRAAFRRVYITFEKSLQERGLQTTGEAATIPRVP